MRRGREGGNEERERDRAYTSVLYLSMNHTYFHAQISNIVNKIIIIKI